MIGTRRASATRLLRRFLHDDSGATAIEYGLIATFIFMAIIVIVTQIGINLQDAYTLAADALN